jgi:methyl-accepting chemotaxis protein
MSNLPSKIPRNLLAEVFNNNPRMIKAFEDLMAQLVQYIPNDISTLSSGLSGTSSSITTVSGNLQSVSSSLGDTSSNLQATSAGLSTLEASLGTMAYQDANNVAITGGTAIIDTLTIHNADFVSTNVTLNDYAGANIATFTNSPVTGNPTKWGVINDNGTPRYFPLF